MTLDLRFKGLLALSGTVQTFTAGLVGCGLETLYDQQNTIEEAFTRAQQQERHDSKTQYVGYRGGIRISNMTLHSVAWIRCCIL